MKLSLVTLAVAIVSVSATSGPPWSRPNCATVTCDPATCPAVDCQCGSRKDYCGCCDFCDTCPGQECTKLFRDPCSEYYQCVLDNPEESFKTGGKGHCIGKPTDPVEDATPSY